MTALSLHEIESTLKTADPHKRHETLRAVADMFLSDARSLGEEQISVYDEVLGVLADNSDKAELTAISLRMAPVENAPRKLIRRLASDDDIAIAGPVLSQSPRLGTNELCEIARAQGNAHLLAISTRKELAEPLTDILIDRGDQEVARSVAHNGSAKLSLAGLERLLQRASSDQALGEQLRARQDIPSETFQAALAKVAARTAKALETAAAAEHLVTRLKQEGRLDEMQIVTFGKEERYPEVVASLAVLSNLKYEVVEGMMYPAESCSLERQWALRGLQSAQSSTLPWRAMACP